jgi:hypothetical protein
LFIAVSKDCRQSAGVESDIAPTRFAVAAVDTCANMEAESKTVAQRMRVMAIRTLGVAEEPFEFIPNL